MTRTIVRDYYFSFRFLVITNAKINLSIIGFDTIISIGLGSSWIFLSSCCCWLLYGIVSCSFIWDQLAGATMWGFLRYYYGGKRLILSDVIGVALNWYCWSFEEIFFRYRSRLFLGAGQRGVDAPGISLSIFWAFFDKCGSNFRLNCWLVQFGIGEKFIY